MKNKLVCLVLLTSLILGGVLLDSRQVYAQNTESKNIVPYNVSEEKLERYRNMTYDELIKIARPAKESKKDVSYNFKTIYYNEFDFGGAPCAQFIQDLYAYPKEKDTLDIYYFMWEFRGGSLYSAKVYHADTYHDENYELVDDREDIKPNNQCINRKIYNNQVEIAKEIAKDNKLDAVILATNNNFADYLSGSVLAGKLKVPILFADGYDDIYVRNFIFDNIKDNGVIYVLGKENNKIVEEMKLGESRVKRMGRNSLIGRVKPNYKVELIGGTNRYDTSRLIAQKLNVKKGTPVIITNGDNSADALSVSSIASIKEYPILLTTQDTLPSEIEEELKNINPSKVYVLGGNGAVSDNVCKKIKEVTKLNEENIKRIYGEDRFDTSLNIVKEFNINTDTIAFASDKNFGDVLSGCILAKKLNAPIILVGEEVLRQKEYVESKKFKNHIYFTSYKGLSNNVINKLSAE